MEKSGKVVLVTGGSSGIGKAIAQRFIEQKDKVIVLDAQKPDFEVTFFETDIRSDKEVKATLGKIPNLDVVVNSAGVYQPASVEEMSEEDIDRVFDTNLKGTFLIAKYTMPLLEESQGVFVAIASSLGLVPEAESAAYCASKAGVIMLVKSLALAYAGRVRVNAALPGPIDTPMLHGAFANKKELEEYAKTVLMQRIGSPEDVANVVEFFASDKANYVTGATYTVDGGESISR